MLYVVAGFKGLVAKSDFSCLILGKPIVRLPVVVAFRTIAAALVLALALVVPAIADTRVALVIGNGAYQNVPRLPNPANDANDVAAALRRTGFDTIVATDLDKNGMENATIRFARAARTADVALFYYSGHALQFNGVNYLASIDAKLTDEADLRRMTRVDDIVADLQQAKNLRILVLDSCRDNPLAEQLRRSIGTTRALPLQRGLAKFDTPQGMIVAYATQAGQTAEDGGGRNSPYTGAFLKHIEEQDEIGTIFREVSEDVYETTRHTQLPELSLSMIGRFYLRSLGQSSGKAGASVIPAPTAPIDDTRLDFEAAERVDTVAGWDAFLKQHPEGFYASLAKERRLRAASKLAMAPNPEMTDQGTPTPASPTAAGLPKADATEAGNGVKAIFEKYRLLGTFAVDCGKPATADNLYYVNRLLGNGAVERDQMSGPITTDWVVFLDKATALRPNEIAVGGTRDGKPAEGVWRIEDKRMLQVEVSLGGEKFVSNARLLQSGREMPWLTRCDTPETMQVTVDGLARTYLLQRPSTQRAWPTIILLHGAGGNAALEAQATGLGQLAPQQGFAAVFPAGRGGRWNHLPPGPESTQFVRLFEPYGGAPDDVAFLKLLVADLVRRGISDPNHIFLAGESAGGAMALRMLCEGADMFAGIGLFIAAMPEPTGANCKPAKAVRVLMMNGTADKALPYAGGRAAPPDNAFPNGTFNVWSTGRLVTFFRQLNACSASAEQSVLPGPHLQRIEVEQSQRCAGGPVIAYRVVDGGHAIPSDLDISDLLLSFFR
jgi:poly(3-hydroxybutyrate) depolymerase/uncharacterized caspase-like protein